MLWDEVSVSSWSRTGADESQTSLTGRLPHSHCSISGPCGLVPRTPLAPLAPVLLVPPVSMFPPPERRLDGSLPVKLLGRLPARLSLVSRPRRWVPSGDIGERGALSSSSVALGERFGGDAARLSETELASELSRASGSDCAAARASLSSSSSTKKHSPADPTHILRSTGSPLMRMRTKRCFLDRMRLSCARKSG